MQRRDAAIEGHGFVEDGDHDLHARRDAVIGGDRRFKFAVSKVVHATEDRIRPWVATEN